MTTSNGVTTTLFYVTLPDAATAETIARHLLEKRLIACANILAPHQAIYEWQGEIQSENELVTLFKTHKDRSAEFVQELERLHPYECPCIIEIDPKSVNKMFSQWITEQTRTL